MGRESSGFAGDGPGSGVLITTVGDAQAVKQIMRAITPPNRDLITLFLKSIWAMP
jgi:hypothetical protein